MFGIDNTFLSRAQSGKVLEDYTPVDEGDVCVNYDKAWFASRKITPPTSLDDFVKPQYKNLLSVQNPVNSAPGFAFLTCHNRTFRRRQMAELLETVEGQWRTHLERLDICIHH